MIMIYAVNGKTKEHRVITGDAPEVDDWRSKMQGWYVVEADADGWIEWSGGECPLPVSDFCAVKLRDCENIQRYCKEFRWEHLNRSSDIIAYKPILEPQAEQANKWNGEGLPPVGTVCEYKYGEEKAYIVAHHMDGEQAIWCESSEGGGLFYGTADDFLPINSEREQWVEKAITQAGKCSAECDVTFAQAIYDALASGDLEPPARN